MYKSRIQRQFAYIFALYDIGSYYWFSEKVLFVAKETEYLTQIVVVPYRQNNCSSPGGNKRFEADSV